MIQFFIWGAWILGQGMYWSFFKLQTEIASEQSWKACLQNLQASRVL